jgi:hydroxymethylglutaryl-CoA lyase
MQDNRVEIIEVGTRDGLQIESKWVPTDQKIAILNAMIGSGIRTIEVTSFVSPKAVPQLSDATEVLAGLIRRHDTYLMALIPNEKGAERAALSLLDGGVLFCSASETHNRKNLNCEIDQTIQRFKPIVKHLHQAGMDAIGAVATAFGCPFEGDVHIESTLKIVGAYVDLGISHVTLGDTTGMATPLNIRSTVRALFRVFPKLQIGLHLHNTRGVGLANVIVGLQEGIRRFDSSVGGLGGCPFAPGATGNICTEDLVYLLSESGFCTGIDLSKAIKVALQMERMLGRGLSGQLMRSGPRLALHSADAIPSAVG